MVTRVKLIKELHAKLRDFLGLGCLTLQEPFEIELGHQQEQQKIMH